MHGQGCRVGCGILLARSQPQIPPKLIFGAQGVPQTPSAPRVPRAPGARTEKRENPLFFECAWGAGHWGARPAAAAAALFSLLVATMPSSGRRGLRRSAAPPTVAFIFGAASVPLAVPRKPARTARKPPARVPFCLLQLPICRSACTTRMRVRRLEVYARSSVYISTGCP